MDDLTKLAIVQTDEILWILVSLRAFDEEVKE